jgi:hypothetical protein
MRAFAAALVLALAACTQPPPSTTPTPVPTREPGTISVTALLDLSGTRLPSGAGQRDALQLWTEQHATGAPRVRLKIVDLAGAGRAILELRRAVTEDRVDAVIIGVPVIYDETFASAVALARVPVLFTLPIADPGGGWGFALAPTPAQLANATIDDAAARVVLAGSVVVSDESTAATAERAALVTDLARRGVVATVAKVTPSDAAKLRATLATSSVAIFAGPAKPYVDAVRGSSTTAFLYFSYLCDPAEIGDLRDAGALATWPGSRWIARAADANAVRLAFLQAYADRFGPSTTVAASAYDALGLIAAVSANEPDAAQMRERLQSSSIPGIATTYSFTVMRHAGFAMSDLVFLRYAGARTAPTAR